MIARRSLTLVASSALVAASALLLTPAAADSSQASSAVSSAVSDAKSKATGWLSSAQTIFDRNKTLVDAGKTKSGFGTTSFSSELDTLQKIDPSKLADPTKAFVTKWQSDMDKLQAATGVDVKKEADNLKNLITGTLLGGSIAISDSNMLAASSVTMSTAGGFSTSTQVGPTMTPVGTTGLLAIATPAGALHVHAVTHDPFGTLAQASAAYAGDFTITKGTSRVGVEFDVKVPLALTLSATPGGAAVGDASVDLRVLDGSTVICSDRRSLARSVVAVLGLAPQIKIATSTKIGCKFSQAVDQEKKYTVVVTGVASAQVKVIGGAHAVLDAVVTKPTLTLETPNKK
jgi:hypothetical protein